MKNIKRLNLPAIVAGGIVVSAAAIAQRAPATNSGGFSLIKERNIFDASRPHLPPPQQLRVDYFVLNGTSSHDDQSIAIFEGNNRQFRGAFAIGDSIAGYKITKISYDSVELEAGANDAFVIPVLAQMRRVDNGPWSLAAKALAANEGTVLPASVKSGAINEIEQRLTDRRNAEMHN